MQGKKRVWVLTDNNGQFNAVTARTNTMNNWLGFSRDNDALGFDVEDFPEPETITTVRNGKLVNLAQPINVASLPMLPGITPATEKRLTRTLVVCFAASTLFIVTVQAIHFGPMLWAFLVR